MRIWLAFRVWWRVLTDGSFANEAAQRLTGAEPRVVQPEPGERPARPAPPTSQPEPVRSEAITLLGALQREARLVDMVKEPLENYSDAQVGAAARDVLRDCGNVLDRMFQLQPVVDQAEGTALDVPAGFDAECYRLTGKVEGEPPYQGKLVHHGWKASICKLPRWSGKAAARWVIAPVEVEVTTSTQSSGGNE